MNCQEPPEPECRCCEECIQLQNERFRRNSYHQGYKAAQPPPKWKNGNGNSYDDCDGEVYSSRAEKRSSGRHKSSSHHQNCSDQKQWVDANTLRTLSNLREKACKFLGTSEGTRTADEDECRPFTRVKESYPYESPVKRKAQNINYEPESNFLRKMKQKGCARETERETCPSSLPQCLHSGYPRERQQQSYAQDAPYSCMRSANDYTGQSIQPKRQYMTERGTQYSDTSSIHDTCTCYRTWRPKSPETECPDDVDLMEEYNELCRELSEFHDELAGVNDVCEDDESDGDEEEARKSEHVSRREKRTKRDTGRGCQQSENDFEPSLKNPHPNSCERCWRYASPSRSPVNKPSQRFDPNFRKSHSDVALNGDRKGKGCQDSRFSKIDPPSDERETKVHQLMSPGSRVGSPIGRLSVTSAGPPGGMGSSEGRNGRGSKSFVGNTSAGPPGGMGSSEGRNGRGSKSFVGNMTAGPPGGIGSEEGRNGRGSKSFVGNMSAGPPGGMGSEEGRNGRGSKSFVGNQFGNRTSKGMLQSRTDNNEMINSQSRTGGSEMKKSQSRGDGRSLSVNFEEKPRRKGEPVQSAPPMFDKSKSGKTSGGGGRLSTSDVVSGAKLRKDSKSKGADGGQGSNMNMKSPSKARTTQSIDRGKQGKDGAGGWVSTCGKEAAGRRLPCSKEATPAKPPCLKHPPAKPPQNIQHRPDCLYNQKTRSDYEVRPVTPGSSSCMCKNAGHQQENARQVYPRRSSDATPRREITSSAHRCGNCQFCRRNSPAREVASSSSRRNRSSSGNTPERRRDSAERGDNPRKYCVFYMNKTKLDRANDVEVLIEELIQAKSRKDSGEGRTKMKRDVVGDSMALRFQKGVNQQCQRPKSNSFIYF